MPDDGAGRLIQANPTLRRTGNKDGNCVMNNGGQLMMYEVWTAVITG